MSARAQVDTHLVDTLTPLSPSLSDDLQLAEIRGDCRKSQQSHNVSPLDWLLAVSYWLLAYRNHRSYQSDRISNL